MLLPVLHHVEALRVRQVDRTQHQRIQDAEHHRICRDSNRQRQNGDHRKARTLAHHPQTEARVLQQRFDEIAARGFAALLLESLVAAELDACLALGLEPEHTGTLQIVGAVLYVGAKFVVHFPIDPGTFKQSGSEGAERGEESHISSGCTARALAMAVARRFQLSVSSRRRLRPAAVNS